MPVSKTIIVDTREQEPLPFPPYLRIVTGAGIAQTVMLKIEKKALSTGDYTTPSGLCLIERKSGGRELWDCVCGNRRKAFMGPGGQLERLASAWVPILLVEQSYPTLLRANEHVREPHKMLSLLFQTCARLRVAPMFVSGYATRDRVGVGEMVARILLSAEGCNDDLDRRLDPGNTGGRKGQLGRKTGASRAAPIERQ